MLAQTPQAGSGGATYFVPGTGAQQTENVWRYLHSDGLGSVRHVTGAAGQAVGQMRYTPFGETAEQSGATSLFGFTGEPQGGLNDLVYLRARYYNPALGRFLTQDSLIPDVTNGQALNPYAYVYNDPINLVDPSGYIPSVGSIGGALGDAVVGAAKRAPDSWKPGINDFAQSGNYFLNWWKSKPDDCDCNQNPDFIVSITQLLNTGANYVTQAAWGKATTPAYLVAERVGAYGHSSLPARYRSLGRNGYRLLRRYQDVNVTGWMRGNYVVDTLENMSTGQAGYLLTSKNGRKVVYLRNVRLDAPHTSTGFLGSIVGAGFIDAFFQVFGDWASDLCLSPEQYAYRAMWAMEFGLLAGIFGAAAGVVAVGVGFPVAIATGASIMVGAAASVMLSDLKKSYLDKVANAY